MRFVGSRLSFFGAGARLRVETRVPVRTRLRSVEAWLSVCALAVPLLIAQPAGAQGVVPTPDPDDTTASFNIADGEMRLDGRVFSVEPKRWRFVLETDVLVLQPDGSSDWNASPNRTIYVGRDARLWTSDSSTLFLMDHIIPGDEISVVGRIRGGVIYARLISIQRRAPRPAPVKRTTPKKPASKKPASRKPRRRSAPINNSSSRVAVAPPVAAVSAPPVVAVPRPSASLPQIPATPRLATSRPATPPVVVSRPVIAAPPTLSKPRVLPSTATRIVQAQPTLPLMPAHTSPKPIVTVPSAPQRSTARAQVSALLAPMEAPLATQPAPVATPTLPASKYFEGMPRLAQSPENTLRVPPPQMSMQTQSVQGIAPQIGSTSEALASRDAIQIAALPRVQTPALTPRDTRVPQLSATPQNSSASRVARLPENAGRVTPNTEETRATGALSQPSAAEITARQNWGVLRAAQSEVRYGFFSGGDASQNLVALTFDDGPHPTGTTAILDVLRREKVPATFFVVGRNVEKHPEIVLRSLSEGHELANHSYHHLQGVPLSVAQWKDEIVRNNRAIQSVTGHDTRWFRAPGCRYSIEALQALAETGMLRADTTNNSGDWQQTDPEAIVQRVLSRLAPGQVLLFHDPAPQTARALPKLIHELRHRGYTFVTLTELARRAQQNNFQPEWCPPGQGIVIAAGPDFKPEPQPINAQAGGPPNALLQIGTTGTH